MVSFEVATRFVWNSLELAIFRPEDSWSFWCLATGDHQGDHITKFYSAPETQTVLGARIYFRLTSDMFTLFLAIFLKRRLLRISR